MKMSDIDKQLEEIAIQEQEYMQDVEKVMAAQDGSHANKTLKAIFVGGPFDGMTFSHEALERVGNGKFTLRFSALKVHNPLTVNLDLEDQPLVDGYLSPMMDDGMLRYETQEVYDTMSD